MILKTVFRNAFFILACLIFNNIQAQEKLVPLSTNPELIKYRTNNPISRLKSTKKINYTSRELPFRDDFSTTNIIPDTSNWIDQDVFISSNMADSLLSIGIATFDIIDANGAIYKTASENSFLCDYLTSKPINLKYPVEKNIIFSFYYLPGGRGGYPSPEDSLILEFKQNPDSSKWFQKWFAVGQDTGLLLKKFKYVSIKFEQTDTAFLKQSFQFRFRNTSSFPKNPLEEINQIDYWHIDYVYLDTGRIASDSIRNDIAFFKPLTSVFNDYATIPYNHLAIDATQYTGIRSNLTFTFGNYFQSQKSPLKYFSVKDLSSGKITTLNRNAHPIDPNTVYSFPDNIITNPLFDTDAKDSVTFDIKEYIEHLDNWPGNDTLRYLQKLKDYYAYDDGTSESGYGLKGNGVEFGQIAYAFNTYVTDTLTGIQMYFNATPNAVTSSLYFKLTIWDDHNGLPGNRIYVEDNDDFTPKDTGRNVFVTFWLKNYFVVTERFYIGWEQLSTDFLNIGYDLDNDNRKNLFYNTSGSWIVSGTNNAEVKPGSLMMRPVFRSTKPLSVPVKSITPLVKIFPNPATDYIQISGLTDTNPVSKLVLINTIGTIVKVVSNPSSQIIELNDLSTGVYIAQLIYRNGKSETIKLLKK